MRCPFCNFEESKVIDSRPTDEGSTIRRRRECIKCKERFTTYERVEERPIIVIKKDGTRESFDQNKIIRGMLKSGEKRPISLKEIEDAADEIEKSISNSMKKEISSKEIGDMVMKELKKLDDVAYIRFASVYREFKDIESFVSELEDIIKEKKR
ncbi:transcriptional regulator NrdR [Peptoniphilus sp. GNH]|nr:transcriptional regulator NrdR [Clostridiales bacterium KA00134]UHR03332.1 transcriptional regulator NrdR [Peptoniphilus sp. GNH]